MKVEKVFLKLAEEKERDTFIPNNIKATLAGAAAGLTSTVGLYSVDTASTSSQTQNYKKYKDTKARDFFDPSKGSKKEVANKLRKKYYSGMGKKLLKTVPAAAVTFGMIPVAHKGLDALDNKLVEMTNNKNKI